jgi:far upstream element-binding protein
VLINQDFPPGTPREVTLIGTHSQIQAAQQMVALILEQGAAAVHMMDGPVLSADILCPQKLIGRIIGAHGHTIKEVETRCGVKVQIHQEQPPPTGGEEAGHRRITVTGNDSSLTQACSLLQYIMTNGGLDTPAYAATHATPATDPVPLLTPPTQTLVQVVECPKSCLGRIIGKGGETVNQIQARTGTRIHIEQSVPPGAPCRVHICGDRAAIEGAIKQLREVATGPAAPPRSSTATAAPITAASVILPVLALFPEQMVLPPLPPNWSEHVTGGGHIYWFNCVTGISQVRLSVPPFSPSLL